MSFESNSGGFGTEAKEICTPNLEERAKEAGERADAASQLKNALLKVNAVVGSHPFRNISSFAEMLGGVELLRIEAGAAYDNALKRLEKEA